MDLAGTTALANGLSQSQRMALLSLLADEDPLVYRTVREKLLSCGPPAAEWLRPHTMSNDPALRRRARQIVLHFDRQAADDHFLASAFATARNSTSNRRVAARADAISADQCRSLSGGAGGVRERTAGPAGFHSRTARNPRSHQPIPVRRTRLCGQRRELLRPGKQLLEPRHGPAEGQCHQLVPAV